jgi:ribose transport system ATP-binding protein
MHSSKNFTKDTILSIHSVNKKFPGVQALDDVSFDVMKGEVHGLVGANGAGKSTLNKIIGGVIQPDEGEIYLNGEQILPLSPRSSQDLGIQVIHQDLNLVQYMTVAENIFLGHELKTGKIFVDKASLRQESKKLLDELGVEIDPDIKVKNLTVSLQQMVAVAAALQRKATVLIFDETTAAITREETDHLFERIRLLKSKGLGIIYVSHHLEEIFEICDMVSILRDGKNTGTLEVKKTTTEEVISLMVGIKMTEQFPERKAAIGDVMLSAENLSNDGQFKDISFSVKRGEILGFFGLIGSGRSEIFKSIFGAQFYSEGKVFFDQKETHIRKPSEAVANGMGFLPEDRKKEGVLLMMSVLKNTTLPSIKDICRGGFIRRKKERIIVNRQIENMHIITPNLEREVRYLSGGNQQKVVLAKWLVTNSSVLILDQPTRGIDVQAKREIYKLINQLAEAGHAIVLISDEMQEIIGMCDRIIVMHEGKIFGRIKSKDATQNKLLKMANGGLEKE